MRFKQIILCMFCIAAAAGLLFWGSLRLDDINIQRGEMKLVMNEPLENAPPSLAFATVAMGAFRGLIVDVLWIRADQLKEEGKFFDARQLAEWITMLQPRFASVWDFHAWNMAYNISVTIPASRPQERWHWVRNGYELIRDKGIEKNPTNIDLYRSLAWILQHKIGNVMDDCHKYYKLQLYHSIKPLIGPGTQEYYIKLAQAPKKLEQVLEDPDTVKFLNELSAADRTFADRQELVNNYLALRQQPSKFPDKNLHIINKYKGTQTLENFDVFANAYYLRDTWKLEPEFMAQLNEIYGPIDYKDPNKILPLDWTLADVHAIYWAALGLKRTEGDKYSFEELNTDRIVFHGLQNLYTRGKVIIYTSTAPSQNDPCDIIEREEVFLFPDLRMFTRYDQAMRAVMAKYEEYGTDPNILAVPHRNMLKRSVLLFYQAGHTDEARRIYNILRKEYPHDKEIQVSLMEYARNRLIIQLQTIGYSSAIEIITMMLQDAYYRYAVYDDDEAFGREKMAKEVYDYYQPGSNDEESNRIALPDFDTMRYAGLAGFMNDPRYPDDLKQNLVNRMHIERPELYEKLKKQREAVLQQMQQQESIQQ
ncbi:MAG: hypothetical protein CVV39_03625 [Planctomycetes bacterium HGW-Planctomycetes-1]|nr:MAG: hypothetical protein CVV39_03625 [Planctomycetes bacterium HGW-Planctomycetes-1]